MKSATRLGEASAIAKSKNREAKTSRIVGIGSRYVMKWVEERNAPGGEWNVGM